MACVATATVFWFVLALNDNMQDTIEVKLQIEDVPDSVTFISGVPAKLYATVRDKGTSLVRNGVLREPTIHVSFPNFANNGMMRFTRSDMLAAMKGIFGSGATVSALTIDSLSLKYTTNPGKRMLVRIRADVSAASGSVISGALEADPKAVYVFADKDVLDTLSWVTTRPIVANNLTETTTVDVAIMPVKDASVRPAHVKVKIPVEPMVLKEAMVTVVPQNVPEGRDLLLFPSKVKVAYYVPMSKFSDENPGIEVYVNYNDIPLTPGDRIPVRLGHYPDNLVNVELRADSVEYTIVK